MQNPATPLDVYVVHQGEQAGSLAWRVAEDLRDGGVRVLLHCGGGSFKSQMKKADGSAAACAVIIGDDEAAANAVMLKPLRGGGEQQRVGLEELQHKVRELIK
jgi:histidyl-tRNA synthetase